MPASPKSNSNAANVALLDQCFLMVCVSTDTTRRICDAGHELFDGDEAPLTCNAS